MYTKGIRKIYTIEKAGLSFELACTMAENGGYKALTFNGDIWINTEGEWVHSPFHITDFTDDKE